MSTFDFKYSFMSQKSFVISMNHSNFFMSGSIMLNNVNTWNWIFNHNFLSSWNLLEITLKLVQLQIQGRIQEFVQGGLKFFSFQGGSAPVGAWKPPEINKFHWSRGGLIPNSPPEYASALNHPSQLEYAWSFPLFSIISPEDASVHCSTV